MKNFLRCFMLVFAVLTATAATGQTDKWSLGTLKVGIMLPLHNNDGDGQRMVEYYRGILLALNDLNVEGVKTEVRAWNVPIDTDIRTTLLDDDASKQHIIIGPLYSSQVGYLANFCKTYDIKLIIPFSITGNDADTNGNVFQVYQPIEELTKKSIGAFIERFPQHQPIFIDCNDPSTTKAAFTKGLRQQLDLAKRSYKLTNLNTPQKDFAKAFSVNQPNVVVVNSEKSPQLNKVFAKLDSLVQSRPGIAISMYGYNDWFMYQRYDLAQFYKYGVYIPTTFYYNPVADRTEEFERKYFEAYGVSMDPSGLPRFGLTGYDHAMFFVRGFHKYGKDFNGTAEQNTWRALQSRLNFSKTEGGGFHNANFQLIHFLPNQSLEAITY